MILIIGGSYQGKLAYAARRFGLSEDDICRGGVDFSRKCLAYIDRWTLECARKGVDPVSVFMDDPGVWRDSIIVATDISGGVVPADPALRAWREANGRLNAWLADRADEVWRLFCGLPQRLK